MDSRFRFIVFAAVLATFVMASSGLALEKKAALAPQGADDAWRGTTTPCFIQYWNSCIGWIWTWSGWSPNDMIGVHYTSCCGGGMTSSLQTLTFLVPTAAPAGDGFTGMLDVWAADGNGCPSGGAIDSRAYLPIVGVQPVDYSGGGGVAVPEDFVVTFTHGASGGGPMRWATDFAAQGPTGPQGCGTCFPTTRVVNSYYYGSPTSIICPGTTLNDGVCTVEWRWAVDLLCASSVEPASWGGVKNLYR